MIEQTLFWDREANLYDRGREMWSRATKLFNLYGVERYNALDAALTVYYGNERHCLGGSNFTGEQVMAALGYTYENADPPAQNVVQMVVDTMVSHTIHDKVRPFYLTEKGDADARDQAQAMMRATEGVLTQEGMYGVLGTAVCKLGFIGDGGFVDFVPDYARNKVTAELVLPHEWLVEKGERVGFRYRLMDRWMCLEDYGYKKTADGDYERDSDGKRIRSDHYDAIKSATTSNIAMLGQKDLREGEVCDQILVITGYHRPSGYVDLDDEASFGIDEDGNVNDEIDPGHDGVRMVMIENHVLHHEPWPYDDFSVCEFFPSKDPIAYGSRGIPETLAGMQLAINRYDRKIENALKMHARTLLVMWRNAKINPNKVTNGEATILMSNVPPGQAIQHIQPNPFPEALTRRSQEVKASAFQQYGMTMMSVAGEKPPGLDHAPGMEHLAEELTLRHTEQSDGWKRLFIKAFKRIIECMRVLALRDPNFSVYYEDDKELEKIVWKDVELARNKFSAKCWPTNLLAKTPSALMRRLTELKAMGPGIMSDQEVRGFLIDAYPDYAALAGDSGATERNIRRKIDRIAKDGYSEEYAPHPYINLAMAKLWASMKINELEEQGNDDAMDEVIKFHEAVVQLERDEMMKNAQAQAGVPPTGMPPGSPSGAPPGPPGMPPGAPPQVPPAPTGMMQ